MHSESISRARQMMQARRLCWSTWTDAELIMIRGEVQSSLRGSQRPNGHVS
ncbi:hypothetical protein N9L19_00210 [bacterium]|nr:hypothetical protein [bacterium]